MARWSFVTNHGAVLSLISQHGQITAREIASRLDITERSVHRIISDLETEGYLQRQRAGRLNIYVVDGAQPLRRPEVENAEVNELLRLLNPKAKPARGLARRSKTGAAS